MLSKPPDAGSRCWVEAIGVGRATRPQLRVPVLLCVLSLKAVPNRPLATVRIRRRALAEHTSRRTKQRPYWPLGDSLDRVTEEFYQHMVLLEAVEPPHMRLPAIVVDPAVELRVDL